MKNIVMVTVLVIAALWLFPWRNINWGKFSMVPVESVSVTGEAKSVEKNQIASFTAGVDSVNENKDSAVKEVNTKVESMIAAVKKFGVKSEDIRTQNLSIYQNEETYYDNGVQKSRKGQWRVSNSVEITLREIDKASGLADLLTNSGATNVYGPNFRMDDTSKAEKGLFDAAMKDAREKAELIAKASGRQLGKVISVAEGGTVSNIYPMALKGDMGGGGAPVEAGSGTVYKNLSVVFELK
jgi:uncharacterized protein